MQRKAKWTLALLLVVCTMPIVGSYALYFFWQPSATSNYGELLAPEELPDVTTENMAGEPVDRETFERKWTMFYPGSGECGERCQHALYAMNQSELAQGRDMSRVARAWLVTDGVTPNSSVTEELRPFEIVHAPQEWLELLPGWESGEHIYLVDPIGNVMMRFPPEPEIEKIIYDIEHLLKYSGLGR